MSHYKYVFNSRTPLPSPDFLCLLLHVAMRWRAYLRLSSSSAVGETRSDLTRHSTPHPPPGNHPAEQIPTDLLSECHCHTSALFPRGCCSVSITFAEKVPPLMKWLIKVRGFANCVTSSLRYLIHVRLANVIDSISDLKWLVLCCSALLAHSACERELYRHKARFYFLAILLS